MAGAVELVVLDQFDRLAWDAARLAIPDDVQAGAGGQRRQEQLERLERAVVPAMRQRLIGDDVVNPDFGFDPLAAREMHVDVGQRAILGGLHGWPPPRLVAASVPTVRCPSFGLCNQPTRWAPAVPARADRVQARTARALRSRATSVCLPADARGKRGFYRDA